MQLAVQGLPQLTLQCRGVVGHGSWVLSVACHSSGAAFASGSSDSKVKLWDLQTRTCAQTITDHTDQVPPPPPSPMGPEETQLCRDHHRLPSQIPPSPHSFLPFGTYQNTLRLISRKVRGGGFLQVVMRNSFHSDCGARNKRCGVYATGAWSSRNSCDTTHFVANSSY